MNLVDLFLEQAARHPDRIALIDGGTSIRYSQLLRRSEALAQRLGAGGLQPGQAVLPIQDVGIDLYVTLLAVFRLGATAVFPEPASGLRGLRAAARAAPIQALIGDWRRHVLHRLLPELRAARVCVSPGAPWVGAAPAPADLPPDAPALLTFTSGSTGCPKGIVRSHGFLLAQHRAVSAVLTPRARDVALISLPMFMLCNLANGVTSVIPACNWRNPGASDPRPLLRQIERHRVTRLVLPPALCRRIVATGARLPHVEEIFTGGGPVFPDLMKSLMKLAPNARITAVYGSSEAEPIAHVTVNEMTAADFEEMGLGGGLLAGAPVGDIDLEIDDDQIWVSGAHVVESYRNPGDDRDTKRRRNGKIWHRTGDAGRLDQRGRLWLLGRHAARSGALFPFCVETAARGMPGVRNAALLRVGSTAILTLECDRPALSPLTQEIVNRWPEGLRVVRLRRIPMDRRHHSKVDYGALRKILVRRGDA